MEQVNEIQEVMGRSYGMFEVDDDELEVELDVLGDDLVFDEDFFYFDDVVLLSVVISELGGEGMKEGNVFVDEFGLSQILQSVK